jgi:iron complex outermembrane receptor protein
MIESEEALCAAARCPKSALAALGGLILLTAAAAAAAAQSADASPPPVSTSAADQELQEITVTGTRIRGVAPVGSTVIQLSQQQIQESGALTVSDVMKEIPQVLNFGVSSSVFGGGATSQGASINATLSNSINLRGLGPGATLTLVDGHRAPYGSLLDSSFDPDNIPAIALERIEVVPDGASAVYGSDAIAGVVNLITRKPFDGAETSYRYGGASGMREWAFDQIGGKTWAGDGLISDGGVMVAYEHSRQGSLPAVDRESLYSDNLSPYGGLSSSLAANVGNIIYNGVAYSIPKGQNGQALTLANLGSAANTQNVWTGADALPQSTRDSVLLNLTQKIGSALEFNLDGYFSRRDLVFNDLSQNSTDVGYTVPNTNPYSPCNASKVQTNPYGIVCPAGGLQVTYNFLGAYGNSDVRTGFAKNWEVNPSLTLNLPHQWRVTLTQSIGQDSELTTDSNYPNASSVAAALALSDPATALNIFCDPAEYTCNSNSVLSSVTGAFRYLNFYRLQGTSLSADGPVFSLPGGDVRLAVGIEHHSETLRNGIVDAGALYGPPGTTLDTTVVDSRTDRVGYGELYIPLVGKGNAVPGIQALELTVAGRAEHYSDVGSTENPKVGINWTPVTGLKAHASYGTSFRAPTLIDVNSAAQAARFAVDYADSQLGLSSNSVHGLLYTVGGNPDLKPETATTWSSGLDWTPVEVPGLSTSLNYYYIIYRNQIGTPAYDVGPGAISANGPGAYDAFVIYNPTLYPGKSNLTAPEFAQLVAAAAASTNPPYYGAPNPNPSTIAALVDGQRANTGVVKTDGIDWNISYAWPTALGRWSAGTAATYVAHYRTAPVSTLALMEEVNEFLYPVRFRDRTQFGWAFGPWSTNVFINYTNPYHIPASLLPATADPSLTEIASYMTVDLTASFDFSRIIPGKVGDGLTATFSAQNAFDRRPPLVVNAGGAAPVLFDPQNASAIGRLLSLQVLKKW